MDTSRYNYIKLKEAVANYYGLLKYHKSVLDTLLLSLPENEHILSEVFKLDSLIFNYETTFEEWLKK